MTTFHIARPLRYVSIAGLMSVSLSCSSAMAGEREEVYGPPRVDAKDVTIPTPISRPDVQALVEWDDQSAHVFSRHWLDAALSSGARITEVYGYDIDFYCMKTARRCGAQPRTSLQLSSTVPTDMLISDHFDGYFSRQVSLGAALDITDNIDLYGEATYRDTGDVVPQDASMPDPLGIDDGAVLFGWGARLDF